MNNQFTKELEVNEKILYQGKANTSKTRNNFARNIILLLTLLLFWIITMVGIKNSIPNVGIIIVLSLFTIIIIGTILKEKINKITNKNNEYIITNKKITLVHKLNEIKTINISDVSTVTINNEKNNYGDINVIIKSENKYVTLYGIENPRYICEIIKKYKEDKYDK